jgi:hypothetical protein
VQIVVTVEEVNEIVRKALEQRGLKFKNLVPKIYRDYDDSEFDGYTADLVDTPIEPTQKEPT